MKEETDSKTESKIGQSDSMFDKLEKLRKEFDLEMKRNPPSVMIDPFEEWDILGS